MTTPQVDATPGWQTSEFWLSLAAVILGAVVSSGVLGTDNVYASIAGAILAALAALGYSHSRGVVKQARSNAAAQLQVAEMRANAARYQFDNTPVQGQA